MIDFWKDELTQKLIVQTRQTGTPEGRLKALAKASLVSHEGEVDVAKAEFALRAWAATDELPRAAVREIDQIRVSHLVGELRLIGASRSTAEQLARMIYVALLGLYTVRQYTPELADDKAFLKLVDLAIFEARSHPSGS